MLVPRKPLASEREFAVSAAGVLCKQHDRLRNIAEAFVQAVGWMRVCDLKGFLIKFGLLRSAALWGGASPSDANFIASATVASGETAIMFLGFGIAKWLIDGDRRRQENCEQPHGAGAHGVVRVYRLRCG